MFDIWKALDDVHLNPKLRVKRASYAQWPGEGGITVDIDGHHRRLGTCRRKAFYRYKNYSPDTWGVDFGQLFKMTCGNFIQDMIDDAMKTAGFHIQSEVPISIIREGDFGRYRLSGRIDEVIKNPGNGNIEICEVKSTGKFGERGKITPAPGAPFLPEVAHVIQTMPYMAWLRMPKQGIKNPVCNILYMSREGAKSHHRVMFGNDDQIVIENSAGKHQWPHVTLPALFEDFDSKARFIVAGEVPQRDYELQWSRETVIFKKEHGELNKTDAKAVEKKLAAGETGDLLAKGDWQCEYCDFKLGCYGHRPDFGPIKEDIAATFSQEGAEPGGDLQAQSAHVPGT